ncbi:hypothetical protein SteCoe_20535 [Stentor coeruleus]|uniref:Uncharacterized protein n=1 Tax=Stentor coeruleus TaxID=5963 RepID=A0A1R2BRP9_9CILI|nr:hypothetical protein SteCoe_20535 [Stentor coeruleus]
MCLHYTFLGDDFNITFLLQESFLNVQYSFVFYYFFIQLSENMRSLLKTKIPLITFNLVTLLSFLIYLIVSISQNQNIYKCNSGIWVYLHSCGMFLSLIFIYLGYHAGKHLYIVAMNFNFIVNYNKIKHFWYDLFRIIIACMTIASITNVCESVYFIDINNDDCYNSYSGNPTWDLVAFIVIRVLSHYLFLFSCLYVFRIERKRGIFSDENTESCKSLFHPYDESQENSWICSSPTTHLDIDLPETPISSKS